MDVDMSLPLYMELMNESAKRSDSKLRRKEDVNDPFTPLTEDEEQVVDNALSYSNRRKDFVNHENSNTIMIGEVLQCLKPWKWLNDELINVYLELLKERDTRHPQKFLKCHFFNTFFFKKASGSFFQHGLGVLATGPNGPDS